MTPVARAVVHPVTLCALGVLLLNDHVLKPAFPGWLTGKLSDFAGLVFLPIVVAYAARGRGPRSVALAALLVGGAFAAVKTSQPVCDAYAQLVGTARWLLTVPGRLLGGASLRAPVPGLVMCDPTDLLAVPFGLVGVVIAARAEERGAKAPARCATGSTTHIVSS